MLLVFLLAIGILSPAYGGLWPKKVFVYRGATPTLDGVIGQDEYADAVALDDFSGWTPQFSPVTRAADLDATVWIKHDGRDFYFAFDVTDDLIYGTDTARWLPGGNPDAHSLTPEGWPWFGDGVELLVNAPYRWITFDEQVAWGDGSSWQMVASTHKSRMGGLDRGGLLAGEPRTRDRAWTNYTAWIESGAMQASVRLKDRATEGSGYVIEWKVSPDPCLEIRPGEYWSPELGPWEMGLNVAVGDLDEKSQGEGNGANFHHEEWWAGERGKRTWLKQWGTMVVMPGPRPEAPDTYPPGSIQLTPKADRPLVTVPLQVPESLQAEISTGLALDLPAGFSAEVFAAKGLRGPRFMAWSPDGVLHVANMKTGGAGQFTPPHDDDDIPPREEMTGQIVALPDRDNDGVADTTVVVAENLWWANNLQFYQGDLYVADRHAVRRFSDTDGDGVYETERQPLALLPPAKQHRTRTLLFDETNDKLYVSVGSTCDLCKEEDPERATILQFNGDGTGRRVFASGLRNAVGLALHPQTNELWATDNGHDRQGPSLPPEMVDIIRDGGFYGWPLAYGYRAWTDLTVPAYNFQLVPFSAADSLKVNSMQRPAALLPARWAPMAIHFYTGETFPPRYKNAALVAIRGGNNAGEPGYRVVSLTGEPGAMQMEDFITGFERDGRQWGKPVGLATDPEGNLYVSSDWFNHVIVRIRAGGLSARWLEPPPARLRGESTARLSGQIRLGGLDPEGDPPEAVADLSAIGGPERLPLAALDDSTFLLDTEAVLTDQAGTRFLRVHASQRTADRIQRFELQHSFDVRPGGDLVAFDDEPRAGWRVDPTRPQHVDLASTGEAAQGESAVALWGNFRAIRFLAPDDLDVSAYTALAFSIHLGQATVPQIGGQLRIGVNADINGSGNRTIHLFPNTSGGHPSAVSLPHIAVDTALRQWQEVVIPLEDLNVGDGLRSILFLGGFEDGPLYIDNLRLVAPAALTAEDAPSDRESPPLLRPARIIDTHIHLFDPTRPEGVPWPGSESILYRPTLPADFRAVAEPVGVTGAVVVEASPWLGDNQWLLDQTQEEPFYHGVVGLLAIGSPDFADQLARFAADGRFVGVRLKRLPEEELDERAIANLQLLADRGLTADVLLSGMSLSDVEALALAAPDLKLMINHLGGVRVTNGSPDAGWVAAIGRLAAYPNVYCKVSGLFQQSGRTPAPVAVDFYAPVLDALWQAFGPERLVYGSNWPVSNLRGAYRQHQELVLGFVSPKGQDAVERVMWRNAVQFYGLEEPGTAVTQETDEALPTRLALAQNFPNPFNGGTVIAYTVPRSEETELAVYNLAGQKVATLISGTLSPGVYTAHWNGRDHAGRSLASGVYLYRIQVGNRSETRRLVLLK